MPKGIPGAVRPRSDGYVRRTVNGIRKLDHVRIWEEHRGKIPRGLQLHHKDFDRANNALGNLELLTPLEHKRKHSGCFKKRGHWIKPCRKCGKPKAVETHFYGKRDGSVMSECKDCHKQRTRRDKKLRRERAAR